MNYTITTLALLTAITIGCAPTQQQTPQSERYNACMDVSKSYGKELQINDLEKPNGSYRLLNLNISQWRPIPHGVSTVSAGFTINAADIPSLDRFIICGTDDPREFKLTGTTFPRLFRADSFQILNYAKIAKSPSGSYKMKGIWEENGEKKSFLNWLYDNGYGNIHFYEDSYLKLTEIVFEKKSGDTTERVLAVYTWLGGYPEKHKEEMESGYETR
jgi:hypothetical protein